MCRCILLGVGAIPLTRGSAGPLTLVGADEVRASLADDADCDELAVVRPVLSCP